MKFGNSHETPCVSKCFAVLRELSSIYLTTLYISEFIWPTWSVNEIWVWIIGGKVLTRKSEIFAEQYCTLTTTDPTWTEQASNPGLRNCYLNPFKRKHAIYKRGSFNPGLGLYATGPRKLDIFLQFCKGLVVETSPSHYDSFLSFFPSEEKN
jgi:hypothetical protein